MKTAAGMQIVIFGLSITSSWGNGHATTFRALVKALNARGHHVHFVEKDVAWYRAHRDLPKPPYCTVQLYNDWDTERAALLASTAHADCIVIGSYFPDATRATEELLALDRAPLLFYDIDTPITLAALRSQGHCEYLLATHIPHYDAYLSFTGGPALQELEQRFHSPCAAAFYCSVDPEIYHPSTPAGVYRADLSYLGTYAADRQPKLIAYLDNAARVLPEHSFLIAGPQYPPEVQWASNVRHLSHVAPPEHPAFYSSARFSLNLTRSDMAALGYSPSVRLFEASACGAAILSDAWIGMEEILNPGEEIIVPASADEVPSLLTGISDAERQALGRRARERVLAQHTAAQRAAQFERIVEGCGRMHAARTHPPSPSAAASEG